MHLSPGKLENPNNLPAPAAQQGFCPVAFPLSQVVAQLRGEDVFQKSPNESFDGRPIFIAGKLEYPRPPPRGRITAGKSG
jgi:hypothetical protein